MGGCLGIEPITVAGADHRQPNQPFPTDAACTMATGLNLATAHRRGGLSPEPLTCERLPFAADSLAPEPLSSGAIL